MDQHNHLGERTALLERDDKTIFKRIDEMRTDIKELKKQGGIAP